MSNKILLSLCGVAFTIIVIGSWLTLTYNQSIKPVTEIPQANHTAWEWLVSDHISHYICYPKEATDKHHEGTVKISLTIDAQGEILNSKVSNSSGSEHLDSAALTILKRASPLPKPSKEALGRKNSISLVLPFVFKLKKE